MTLGLATLGFASWSCRQLWRPAPAAILLSDSPLLTTWTVAATAGRASEVETTAAPTTTAVRRAVQRNPGRGGNSWRAKASLLRLRGTDPDPGLGPRLRRRLGCGGRPGWTGVPAGCAERHQWGGCPFRAHKSRRIEVGLPTAQA